jgi:3-oxoacyl-[acyl-carrier protein] reductase
MPDAPLPLLDKVALVTGGSRGLGREMVLAFAEAGASVVIASRKLEACEALAAEVTERTGRDALPVAANVSRWEDCDALAAAAHEHFGRVDVLVNNAGINVEGLVEDLSDEDWDRCFDVNVAGTFKMCRAVVPAMKAQRSGRIVNAASFAAIVPSVGSAAYAASKSAVVSLTRVLASELGPWDVTVNAYAPGMVPTAMNGFAELAPAAADRLLDTLSLRRWGDPDEVADVVCFLASDAARYVTGTLVDVSGGKLATQVPRKAYDLAEQA